MIQIFNKITEAGGYPLIVGGYVRDTLLGLSPKDVDVEVYRIDANKLESILSTFGKVDSVGKSFGILKLNFEGKILDFSLPRRESKSGAGHTGFQVEVDPTMTVKEAAARRDFTINSLAVNPITDEVLDYYGGMDDLHFRVLKHTSPAFSEDPLRVLRGMQFCSRFNLVPTGETLQLCRDLAPTYGELAKERVYEELKKWSLSPYPSRGLQFLLDCGWLKHFPALFNMVGCEQDPVWHPEGWSHSIFSQESGITSSTHTESINTPLRDFLSIFSTFNTHGKCTNQTFSVDKTNFSSMGIALDTSGKSNIRIKSKNTITTTTSTFSFVFSESQTITTNKSFRVVFNIPFCRMNAVMQSSINDSEIIQGIISPIAIYMMDVLASLKLSTKVQLHKESMNPLTPLDDNRICFHISANIVNFTFISVDNDIINASIDILFDEKINHNYLLKYYKKELQIKQGDVFTHTKYVCDEAALIAMREGFTKEETSNLLFAALLHDVGKRSTTFTKNGRIVSPGHDVAGEALAASWMESLNFPHQSAHEIKTLVRTHMVHCGGVSARKARRLIHRVKPNFKLLWALIEADHSGRPPLPKSFPQSAASLKELVDAQDVREPLVKGRHLLELGWEAGPSMGKELKRLFELQIEEGLGFDQLINNVKN